MSIITTHHISQGDKLNQKSFSNLFFINRLASLLSACVSTKSSTSKPTIAPTTVHWTYEGEEGPEKCGNLSPDYGTCSLGKSQSPSEHSINGNHANAELYLVHKSVEGKLAVLGILINQGKENPAFISTLNNLPATKGVVQNLSLDVDVTGMLPFDQQTYRYIGSLTTPPCTEGVLWNLMIQPIQMSGKQLSDFTALFEGNNRPVQPLNNRSLVEDSSP